jgi:uncharacterized membrane-anchored protein
MAHLGFFGSVLLFAAAISVPAIAWWRGKLNPIVAFWAAYIVTRPLGASFADWFGKPDSLTGLGLGDGAVSAVALAVFVLLVAYVAATKRDILSPVLERPHPHPHREHPHLQLGPLGAVIQPSPTDP